MTALESAFSATPSAHPNGAFRSWMGMVGWDGSVGGDVSPTRPARGASNGDTLVVVADPIAEMLLGDLPNVAVPSVEEMFDGDQRRRWAWSGSPFHWLPGTDGNPGRPPSRLADLREFGTPVAVDASACAPAMLDHLSAPSLRQICTVPTGAARDGFSVEIIRSTAGSGPGSWRDEVRTAVRGSDVVLVDPRRFRSGAEAAYVVACAAAFAIPVWVTGWTGELTSCLAPGFVDELAACEPARLLDDAYYRDLIGVRLRRHVLKHHSAEAIWGRLHAQDQSVASASVLVMVSCIRPEYLEQVVRYLNAQSYQDFEAHVVIDRVELDPEIERSCREAAEFDLRIDLNREPLTVGEIYNGIMRSSDADVAVIWDDDDHYAPEHLEDLVQALVWSRATIAGKWAEFFHLAGPDITIQRSPNDRYRDTPSIGGSNLAMWRSAVLAFGGFMPTTLGYDQELIERVRSRGGRTYRTHGYGYLATRRKSGHTWNPGDTYFLEQSVRQWPGLELRSAGFGTPRNTVSGKRYR